MSKSTEYVAWADPKTLIATDAGTLRLLKPNQLGDLTIGLPTWSEVTQITSTIITYAGHTLANSLSTLAKHLNDSAKKPLATPEPFTAAPPPAPAPIAIQSRIAVLVFSSDHAEQVRLHEDELGIWYASYDLESDAFVHGCHPHFCDRDVNPNSFSLGATPESATPYWKTFLGSMAPGGFHTKGKSGHYTVPKAPEQQADMRGMPIADRNRSTSSSSNTSAMAPPSRWSDPWSFCSDDGRSSPNDYFAVLAAYEKTFGKDDVFLKHYMSRGCGIQVDLDIWYGPATHEKLQENRYIIYIDKEDHIDALTAAFLLRKELLSIYTKDNKMLLALEGWVEQNKVYKATSEVLSKGRLQEIKEAVEGLQFWCELGMSIASEPVDWVITFRDVTEFAAHGDFFKAGITLLFTAVPFVSGKTAGLVFRWGDKVFEVPEAAVRQLDEAARVGTAKLDEVYEQLALKGQVPHILMYRVAKKMDEVFRGAPVSNAGGPGKWEWKTRETNGSQLVQAELSGKGYRRKPNGNLEIEEYQVWTGNWDGLKKVMIDCDAFSNSTLREIKGDYAWLLKKGCEDIHKFEVGRLINQLKAYVDAVKYHRSRGFPDLKAECWLPKDQKDVWASVLKDDAIKDYVEKALLTFIYY